MLDLEWSEVATFTPVTWVALANREMQGKLSYTYGTNKDFVKYLIFVNQIEPGIIISFIEFSCCFAKDVTYNDIKKGRNYKGISHIIRKLMQYLKRVLSIKSIILH